MFSPIFLFYSLQKYVYVFQIGTGLRQSSNLNYGNPCVSALYLSECIK